MAGQITHSGIVRDDIIAAPPRENITRKLPLVLVLHGAGGTGRYALNTYHRGDRAVADGFIAAVIDAVSGTYPGDRARIYVTWFSGGASMTLLLGMRLSNRLATNDTPAPHLLRQA